MDDELKAQLIENYLGCKIRSTWMGKEQFNGPYDSDAWHCKLTSPWSSATLPFFKGSGHQGQAPTVSEVLYCLIADARIAQNGYDEFLSDFGTEDDAEQRKTFKSITRQSVRFERLFPDISANLIWNDESELALRLKQLCQEEPSFLLPNPKKGRIWGLLSAAVFLGSKDLAQYAFESGGSSLTELNGMQGLQSLCSESNTFTSDPDAFEEWLIQKDHRLEAEHLFENIQKKPQAKRLKKTLVL